MARQSFNDLVDFAAATLGYTQQEAEVWALARLEAHEKEEEQLAFGDEPRLVTESGADDWGGF